MIQTHDAPNETLVRVFQQFNLFVGNVDHEQVSGVATADQRLVAHSNAGDAFELQLVCWLLIFPKHERAVFCNTHELLYHCALLRAWLDHAHEVY
jgi:hypothetical protein